ncbi:dihydrolipoyl dehydrogenase [Anaerovorax sp. IOR16]|uniref:dihydrolipoyl dehydrogenase n=1 Tax=Anaerovorax sp. IOR16 TaxID=2773458 RepID=UPI0019D11AEC|nr:dihydrolipoyl dehydrogenase [Anaerovorax sp. IOR16]
MEEKKYDIVVIGGGPGGYEAALRASELGMKAAVVEKEHIGGTCLNHGCIPTKTLLHTANWYRHAKEFDLMGLHIDHLSYDINKMQQRKDEVIKTLRGGILSLFKLNKIDYWNGCATITGNHEIEIQLNINEQEDSLKSEKKILYAENILIATGAKPVKLPIPGIELPNVFTSEQILEKNDLFKRILIIGGGVMGVEFATMFNGLDCEVVILEAEKRILPLLDREISQKLSMILKKRGVRIETGVQVEEIMQMEKDKKDTLLIRASNGLSIEADGVLVSVGRKPNIDSLFSEEWRQSEGISLQLESGKIIVDENYETTVQGIYAVGDVIGGIQLAHMATAEGISAVEHIANVKRSIQLKVVPSCIYSNPEIATVGITAEEAKAQGMAAKTGKYSMMANGKSLIENQQMGFIKVVYLEETGVIIGAQMMCERATDLISELATAVANQLTVEQLASVIRPHPTFCEGIGLAIR